MYYIFLSNFNKLVGHLNYRKYILLPKVKIKSLLHRFSGTVLRQPCERLDVLSLISGHRSHSYLHRNHVTCDLQCNPHIHGGLLQEVKLIY